jgi:hypothetical protein
MTSITRRLTICLSAPLRQRRFLAALTHLFALIACVLAPATAHAQAGLAVGLFSTPFTNGALQSDWGAKALITAGSGTGAEMRWGKATDDTTWFLGLYQTIPAVRGAKTLQPFASAGAFRVERAAQHADGLSVAGGVAAFVGHLGFDVDFRYFWSFQQLADEKIRARHVSFGLLWRF